MALHTDLAAWRLTPEYSQWKEGALPKYRHHLGNLIDFRVRAEEQLKKMKADTMSSEGIVRKRQEDVDKMSQVEAAYALMLTDLEMEVFKNLNQ
jgi:hypothetical protein